MPRPRTVQDDAIFAATAKVMSRDGPAKLTLARIAQEAGLAAPTLVQRFGSKIALLRAMSQVYRAGTETFIDELRRSIASPRDRVREFALCFAGLAPTAKALTNNTLVYLQIDLADPVLRRNLVATQREQKKALSRLVSEAIAAGEISPSVDPDALARVLLHLATGALLAWALHRQGSARDYLARDLDAMLTVPVVEPRVSGSERARHPPAKVARKCKGSGGSSAATHTKV